MLVLKNIIKIDKTTSTNDYALELLRKHQLNEGTVIVANEQTAGRGQREGYWESEPGGNLTFSIVFFPGFLNAGNQFLLSKAVSVAIADFLSLHIDNVKVKWPNDIYVGDAKIGGMLIENSLRGQNIHYSVVGVGLNINQMEFKSNAPNPVSLKQLTGKTYNLNEVLQNLCKSIENAYLQLFYEYKKNRETGLKYLDKLYLNSMYRFNTEASYKSKQAGDFDKIFNATITGVDEYGRLKLKNRVGEELVFSFKEIEFLNLRDSA